MFGGASEVLDVGRARRLFTGSQRVALAERDGGCRWPGCDRPPSWTEAHHIDPWAAGGRTDLDDGVLLCRHHHLLLHNNGWRVVRARDPGQFALIPPRELDAQQRPRPMPTRRRGQVRVRSRVG
ncbi:HNH endonuclease signature motif containing protein [Diaminobutyricibacter sp. McL0608]|uniref:HNH endonuclease signature motif containing protein n=1 Tax=Leifsonia sp. McL0608 TaxID=3143537 RepID=UPI0031F2EA43